MYSHTEFIEQKLKKPIENLGPLKVGINLNEYFSFDDANEYALMYAKKFNKAKTNDRARQEKSSKDSVLGKLVEEVVIYLLENYFRQNHFDYLVTNNKSENEVIRNLVNSLCIKRNNTGHIKHFDSDIIIYNKENFASTRKVFILSAKGTTRERIGQFLSHLFLMDSDVLDAKYGKDKYEVIFTKQNISLKYAFVTLDWAKSKDFTKYTQKGKEKATVKTTEVQLILDDQRLGGGIYVLNNFENIDGIGNFASLVGKICDYLK
ncbi:MAG: hypothetical protein NZ455_14080 [Bacteroidia bacterium]|nr:hypothetical protein [Bacteroidia bacterium]MDW8348458.1 hypothetical protein [Bacteroidia bacterium]